MNKKKCSKCGEVKDLSNFSRNKARYDGFQNNCKECNKLERIKRSEEHKNYMREYYKENKETLAEKYKESRSKYGKQYREKNKDQLSQKRKEKYKKDKERLLQNNKEYRSLNKDRLDEYRRKYMKENKEILAALSAKRRSYKLNATPPWLSSEDLDKIKILYRTAKILQEIHGIKFHVDHIIPLKGENVCGLHVPWNLQILTAEDNMKKGNKLLDQSCD